MKCLNCPYYECYPSSNKCNLLFWECYREQDKCKLVNDDGSINEEVYQKVEEYIW